jgi:hypothetical protein
LALGYKEVQKIINGEAKKFAVIYIPPSAAILKPIKYATYTDKGKVRLAFRKDEIFFRRGTQSERASLNEIRFVEKRIKDAEHKISLISGRPDRIRENLYGNFFKVLKSPPCIFEGEIPKNIRFRRFETINTPYIRQGEKIYSFCDLAQTPFQEYIRKSSFNKRAVREFLETQDRRILLIWLLNSEIGNVALNKGMRYDRNSRNVYFYPTDSPERFENWEGRYRKTRKRVAKRIYVRELKRSLVAHDAALIAFTLIGNDLYLKILPTIVLTHDGYETISGFREGPVKTRLQYNKFNDAYLNLILFWISRLKSMSGDVLDLDGRVTISTQPVAVSLDWGIMKDRPSSEFKDRKSELYSFEAVDIT